MSELCHDIIQICRLGHHLGRLRKGPKSNVCPMLYGLVCVPFLMIHVSYSQQMFSDIYVDNILSGTDGIGLYQKSCPARQIAYGGRFPVEEMGCQQGRGSLEH